MIVCMGLALGIHFSHLSKKHPVTALHFLTYFTGHKYLGFCSNRSDCFFIMPEWDFMDSIDHSSSLSSVTRSFGSDNVIQEFQYINKPSTPDKQ